MNKLYIPNGYRSKMDLYRTQKAISFIKQTFQSHLAENLRLKRVSAPLFVTHASGLNDNLNGTERPVSFDVPAVGESAEVVHSLAKWKRLALHEYHFYVGNGLYTDMNAIRRDEETDNIHSVFVDQWDWEKILRPNERTREYLHRTVRYIYDALRQTENYISDDYNFIGHLLPEEITFITSAELEAKYPDLCPKEREYRAAKEYGALFLEQIGSALPLSGKPHDGRAPDYDDWSTDNGEGSTGLNGDIMLWNTVLDCPFEISSMGIRVDAKALRCQLEKAGCPERANLKFHKALLDGKYPLSIGGGIGQSRLCMFLLQKAHIGEVQASIWPEEQIKQLAAAGIRLI